MSQPTDAEPKGWEVTEGNGRATFGLRGSAAVSAGCRLLIFVEVNLIYPSNHLMKPKLFNTQSMVHRARPSFPALGIERRAARHGSPALL
jgi:hypothetical protein